MRKHSYLSFVAIAAMSKKSSVASPHAILRVCRGLIALFSSRLQGVGKRSNSFRFGKSSIRAKIGILRSKLPFLLGVNVHLVGYSFTEHSDYLPVTGTG